MIEDNKNVGVSLKESLRADWLALIIIAASFVTAFIIYPHMPRQVPAHWNFQGEVDRYTSRFWGTFGPPLVTAGIYLLMLILPAIDPRRKNYLKFTKAFQVLKLALVVFMAGLYTITITYSLGYSVSVNRFVPLGVSILFIIFGNYMGQIRHNYFIGIKTPWTLASEGVWRKTHRFGAKVWVIAGLAGVVGSLISGKPGYIILITAFVIAAVLPLVYSYLVYKWKE